MSAKFPSIFRRSLSYVFVKPVRLAHDLVAQPGESADQLREYHKRSLLRRRRIGPVGHEWTEEQLGAFAVATAVSPATNSISESATPTMTHAGGSWYEIVHTDGTVEKVQGKSAATERMAELTGEA
jgi:hypothetical protein